MALVFGNILKAPLQISAGILGAFFWTIWCAQQLGSVSLLLCYCC